MSKSFAEIKAEAQRGIVARTPRGIIPPAANGERPEIVEFPENWPGVKFTDVGLVFADHLDKETWTNLGRWLGAMNARTKLWVADWALESERREWGHSYDDLMSITGLAYETLMSYVSIGRNVPIQNRILGNKTSYYAAVAPLSHREQARMLGEAKAKGWTRDHLRTAVKALRGDVQGSALDATLADDPLLADEMEAAANLVPAQEIGNGRHKPKTNRAGDQYAPQGFDACQTPPYALDPLLGYLDPSWTIWEPAAGEGLLVEALLDGGLGRVMSTDLLTGNNFFDYEPDQWDALVTNPPYSIKYDWLRRCYELGKPFALLLPVETLGAKTAQELFRVFDVQVMFLDKRINFKMPNIGFEGSSAQFPVAWFCWQLPLEKDMVFANVNDLH